MQMMHFFLLEQTNTNFKLYAWFSLTNILPLYVAIQSIGITTGGRIDIMYASY